MSKNAVRNRRNKVELELVKPATKEKFLKDALVIEAQQQAPVPKFVPATQNQKKAVALLRGGTKVLFLQGSSGTGKSMLAAWWASCLMKEKKIEKIYLVRPSVATGKTAGYLPGTEHEKLLPFFAQTLTHLATFMGQGYLNYCVEKELIELKSGEYLRGRSFQDCVVLVEEAQNFTHSDMEMVLTRMGNESTLILTGDTKQNDLRGASGLGTTIDLINKMIYEQPDYMADEDLASLENLVGSVEFLPEDCVRSGLTRAFVKMYYNE